MRNAQDNELWPRTTDLKSSERTTTTETSAINWHARQPFGRISIANADAAASPHTDAAIGEAYRAVTEIVDRRSMPMLS